MIGAAWIERDGVTPGDIAILARRHVDVRNIVRALTEERIIAQAGGMMTKTPQTPAPFWLYYFNVDALDAAITRVKNAGGQIIIDPMEVPGPMWVVHCLDPQGAMFAMVGPKR